MKAINPTTILRWVLSLLLLFASGALRGDTNVYWDSDHGLEPTTAVVTPGATVTWWNIDPYGLDVTVTFSPGPSFDIPDHSARSVIFLQTGTYTYTTDRDDSGTVIVALAPSIALTAPANKAAFSSPATFGVTAEASETAGDSVADVQFLLADSLGTNPVGDSATAPYTIGITNLAPGTFTLLAIATDAYGLTATNSITFTVIAATQPTLVAPQLVAGQFLFYAVGLTIGTTNILETTTDFTNWTPVATNIPAGTSLVVTNPVGTGRSFFYRWLQLP